MLARKAPTIRLGPSRFKTDTSPVLREINVKEQSAEVVLPLIVVHHEGTIVGIWIELFIWRQGGNIGIDVILVHLSFLTVVSPLEFPL